MTDPVPVFASSPLDSPRVRRISSDHPWKWLTSGWRDVTRAPVTTVVFGSIFVLMGYALTYMVAERFHMALALVSGFLLLGPFLALGFYEISRRLEAGENVTLTAAMLAWRHNTRNLVLFAALLGLIMVVWARLSALMYAVVFLQRDIIVERDPSALFFSGDGLLFLVTFMLVGAVLAALVFCLSVVAIPMLLDRDCDFLTAVLTSLTAVRVNPGPMFLWAAMIVVVTGAGLVTLFVGLAVTMPLIGCATWHAYRDVVENR